MKFLVAFLMVFVIFVAVFAAPTVNDGLPTERKCVAGKSYYDGCNNCWCANGFTACTYKACAQMLENGTIIASKTIPPPEDYWATD